MPFQEVWDLDEGGTSTAALEAILLTQLICAMISFMFPQVRV